MTIGISALSESWMTGTPQCIVMATDTRGTFPSGSGLGPHDMTGKQFSLPYNFAANIAGTVSVCSGIESEIHNQMLSLPSPFYHDHIRNAIRESQFYELTNRVNYALKSQLGITLMEWKQENLAQWFRLEGKRVIQSIELPMQITVGGFANGEPVLLAAELNESPEMETTFSVIGSGTYAALDVLCRRKQEPYMTLQRTLLHVAEALEAARLDAIRRDPQNPDVGDAADFVVITPRYFRRLSAKDKTLLRLMKRFANFKDSDSLDSDDKARTQATNLQQIYLDW